MGRAPICHIHRKVLTFVEAENYTYWQCPEGCWLDIDPPNWGDSKLRWPKPASSKPDGGLGTRERLTKSKST